jgi:hypothetical protein
MHERLRGRTLVLTAALTAAIVASMAPAASAAAANYPAYEFKTPVFGLAARGDTLFVADAGQGVVRLRNSQADVVVDLPNVSDVDTVRNGRMWAVTSGPRDKKLWFINGHRPHLVANLGRFEKDVNPARGPIDSNPFDVEALGKGKALIADAAANALLIADRRGNVDWVATLPNERVPTKNAKNLVGCPDADPAFADICALPQRIPAEPVSTSIDVGPDGAYYVGELKGFPAPLRHSQVWRIVPGTRHARCGASADCSVVLGGLTSIVDLHFGGDGTLYVTELDEASWFGLEIGSPAGGTIDACDVDAGTCADAATDQTIPMAVTHTADGAVWAIVEALAPTAQVVQIA